MCPHRAYGSADYGFAAWSVCSNPTFGGVYHACADRAILDLIIFPEPNRKKHLATKGLFRPGDFFSLRYPFERPAVPLAAYYRVQFIGLHVLGKPLILTPPFNGGSDVYVELPRSPFVGRWKSKDWGSKELPAYRLRQQARRAIERARQEKERRDLEALGGESLGHEPVEDT